MTNRMRLAALIGILVLGGCDPAPVAQESAAAPDAAIIDLDVIAKALGRDRELARQLESANEALSGKMSELASDLKGQLQAQQAKIGEEASAEDQAELRKLVTQAQLQLRRSQQAARQQSQQYQLKLVEQFRAEVLPYAERVARERGIRVVMIRSTVLWYDISADITQPVIDLMRGDGDG